MTQVIKEKNFIGFVSQDTNNKRDEGGGMNPPIAKKEGVISTISIHAESAKEGGGPSSSSKPSEGSEEVGMDMEDIVGFCRYAMGIYDFQ